MTAPITTPMIRRLGRPNPSRVRTGRLRPTRGGSVAAVTIALSLVLAPTALAHGPDPVIGAKQWTPNRVVQWSWRAGQIPPAWMSVEIETAANASNASRASRAATFSRVASAASLIAYGEPTGCSSQGIACFSRVGDPTSFSIWFRANGWRFDWGRLSWCQGPDGVANGCFDVQNVALDEFGHVLGLGHHANLADQSDFLDAVVQTVSRARPAVGWNAHVYGVCDTARLQLEYDRPSTSSPFSTCLAITTATTLATSATSIWVGDPVRFTATLKTSTASTNRALSGDAIAGRPVILQRRAPGATAWTTIGSMPATTAGSYELTLYPSATYDWRATFTPSGEGLVGSVSPTRRVTVSSCTGSMCASRVDGVSVLSGRAR